MRIKSKKNVVAWAFVGPVIVYYLILTLIPLLMVFYYSFTDWNGLSLSWNMIGFDNFVEIFTDSYYFEPLIRTVWVSLIIIFGGLVVAIPLAGLMSKEIRGMGFFRTLYFIPCVISLAIVAQIISLWLQPYGGTFNTIRNYFGLQSINFKQDAGQMLFWIIVLCIWKGLGGTIILLVAAIQGIDSTLYEAAEVDGASVFKQFVKITIPMLRPMLTFVLVTSVVGVFGIFEPVKLISEGGPNGQTRVILYSIYEEAFSNSRMGMSNALSVVVFLLTMVLTYISYKARENKDDAESKQVKKTKSL